MGGPALAAERIGEAAPTHLGGFPKGQPTPTATRMQAVGEGRESVEELVSEPEEEGGEVSYERHQEVERQINNVLAVLEQGMPWGAAIYQFDPHLYQIMSPAQKRALAQLQEEYENR